MRDAVKYRRARTLAHPRAIGAQPDGQIGWHVKRFDCPSPERSHAIAEPDICLRRKTNFTNPFNPITPSTPLRENILLSFIQKLMFNTPVPCPIERGVSRSSRNVGCGMRWACRCCSVGLSCADEQRDAHGQVASSRYPDAGITLVMMRSASHGQWWPTSPAHQGEREAAVKTIARGRPVVAAHSW